MHKGSIKLTNSPRIKGRDLDDTLKASIGPGIGWHVIYDDSSNVVRVDYEYPAALGYDPAAIESLVRAHNVPVDQDDDAARVQKASLRAATEQDKLSEVLGGWDALVARVAALERAKGG